MHSTLYLQQFCYSYIPTDRDAGSYSPYLVNDSEMLVEVTTVFSTYNALQNTLKSFGNWSKNGGGHFFMGLEKCFC